MTYKGKSFIVTETDRNMEYYVNQFVSDDSIKRKLLNSKILLLPKDRNSPTKNWNYLDGSKKLYQYIQDNLQNSDDVQVCTEDGINDEVACFGAIEIIAYLVVNSSFTQIALSIISSYIYDLLKRHKETTHIEITQIFVFDKEMNLKSLESKFKGNPDHFNNEYAPFMIELVKNMSSNKQLR